MQKIKEFFSKIWLFAKNVPIYLKTHRKKVIIYLLIIALIFLAIYLAKKYIFKEEPKQVYDVLIMIRDKKSSGPSSLKRGDVLLTKKDNPKWSRTEQISYLILKMDLTAEQNQKITSPIDRELSEEEIEKEMKQFREGMEARENIDKEEIERFKAELEQRRETVKARAYYIDMDKHFPDFKPQQLIKGQPYDGEVFSWKIMKKRK